MRQGLFWRAIKYRIQRNTIGIDAATYLRDLIINYREKNIYIDLPDKDLNINSKKCTDFIAAPDEIIGAHYRAILEQNNR